MDLGDGPGGVFRDQRLRIGRGLFQGRQVVAAPHVSQRHADVSKESAALDSLDGGMTKKVAKGGLVERQVVAQGHADGGARGKGGFA